MVVVHIEKPANKTLAEWFEEIRGWLDANECQPSKFVSAGRRVDYRLYRVSFDDKAKACQFSSAFANYGSVLRLPTSSERQAHDATETVEESRS